MDLVVALALVGAGILCYIVETMNPGFIVVGVLGVFAPDLFGFALAWLAIIVLAAVSAYVTMRVYKRIASPEVSTTTTSVDTLVGKRGVAVGDITAQSGHVRIEGEQWGARSPSPIAAGTRVQVVGREGNLVLTVQPIQE
jgi:membrane protein implicated in regulation of membrane protease activity